jgi:hypothetical protein
MMRFFCLLVALAACLSGQPKVPKIWDDKALADWATPIAALGVRPAHFTASEYYSVAAQNLRTYPVYHPDKEPPGYWGWLQKQTPQPLVDASKLRSRQDWIRAGGAAFRAVDNVPFRTNDPVKIRALRDPKSWEGVWTQPDGTLLSTRWVVTAEGVQVTLADCAACHTRVLANGTVLVGAPVGRPPIGSRTHAVVGIPQSRLSPAFVFRGDPRPVEEWRKFTVPWQPDSRVEAMRNSSDPRSHCALSPLYASGDVQPGAW